MNIDNFKIYIWHYKIKTNKGNDYYARIIQKAPNPEIAKSLMPRKLLNIVRKGIPYLICHPDKHYDSMTFEQSPILKNAQSNNLEWCIIDSDLSAYLATTIPVEFIPVKLEQVKPEPIKLEPVKQESVKPEPVKPEPVRTIKLIRKNNISPTKVLNINAPEFTPIKPENVKKVMNIHAVEFKPIINTQINPRPSKALKIVFKENS